MSTVISTVLNIVIGGLIMGGIYALISMGLSIQYGVARILNVSHGEFIMIAAFLTLGAQFRPCVSHSRPDHLLSLHVFDRLYPSHHRLQRLALVSRSAAAYEGNAMLLSFGLMFIMSNIGLLIWGSNAEGI